MKTILRLLALLVFTGHAIAAEESAPATVAQTFYDAYMKVLLANGDTQKFVLASKTLTSGFKKAYRQMIKDGMSSDPIICGQDFPDEGFKATVEEIDGDKAKVKMKSRGDTLKHSFDVSLKKVEGEWLISDTNDLKADAKD
jgi:hypothetical protein